MVCVYCASDSSVTNSRLTTNGQVVWRRRRCKICNAEWTTREATDESSAYMVKDKSGNLEPFKRSRIFISIYEACRHRKEPLEDSEALTDTVITRLKDTQNAIWSSKRIIDEVERVLKAYDPTAASVYLALRNN